MGHRWLCGLLAPLILHRLGARLRLLWRESHLAVRVVPRLATWALDFRGPRPSVVCRGGFGLGWERRELHGFLTVGGCARRVALGILL